MDDLEIITEHANEAYRGEQDDLTLVLASDVRSLLAELRRVKEGNERLTGAVDGMKEDAAWYIAEVNRLREIEKAAREALERIANAPASLDEGRIMRTIALNALQPQTETT